MEEELLNYVNFIKGQYSEEDLKMVKFVYETQILFSQMTTEKVKEGDGFVDKPNGILDLSFLRLCAKNFTDKDHIFEKIFVYYCGFALKENKSYWKLNLKKLDSEIKAKCSYCSTKSIKSCPFKLLAYIRQCIQDNNFDGALVMNLLTNTEEKNYTNEEYIVNGIRDEINRTVKNNIDLVAAQLILNTDLIQIENASEGRLYFNQIDVDVQTNSFFNNLHEFYYDKKGVKLSIEIPNAGDEREIFNDSPSYLFNKSPFEIAAYIRYICQKGNVSENDVIKSVLTLRKFKESEFKNVYFKHYSYIVDTLECNEKEKNEIKELLIYARNYYYNESLPYIHFNVALFTKNTVIAELVINIINRYMMTYDYIGSKGTIWIDLELLIKRTKDSLDMISQIDRIYSENSMVIFENMEKMVGSNEYRVDAFFTAVEKFSLRNKKSMTVFISSEDFYKQVVKKHPLMDSLIVNRKIVINGMDKEIVKSKILDKLRNVLPIDEEFEKQVDLYIDSTYVPEIVNEFDYIETVSNEILYKKFKELEISNKFYREDSIEAENVRNTDEILNDLNNLVGLTEIKSNVTELIKYLEFSKKLGDNKDFINLNMIFKGNSGTGKTTVARLLAELFFKLGYIKKNNLVEVTSKDLIGSHLGETAPKTQSVIDSALDGVLLIDEAYTLMGSKNGSTANFTSECMGTICKAMELYNDRLVIIFAGYTKEMNEFINENQGLMSRIGYEFEFPDFTKDELLEVFRRQAQKANFELEYGVEDKIQKMIVKNKIGRNFGNARFVINLFDKLIITHSSNYEGEENLRKITNRDVEIYESTKKDKDRTIEDVLSDLNSLIGLGRAKETINGFVSVMELNKKLDRAPDFNMHMIFKGNAGTGKTTVARLIAEIYYNLGYIKKNKLVEVQSQDLIGEFIGQTGPKTQAVIESALDGVLFIDEAYAIMDHRGQNADYSAECIATLLKAMEDYQGRLIIIFAGYTHEMMEFRDLNPGLKSRVGFEIDFDDYSIDELMEIYYKKVTEKQYKTIYETNEKVRKIIDDAKKVENFGNGRFVENMIQRIIMQHAINTRGIDDYERLITFLPEDVPNVEAQQSRKRIGF